MRSFVVPLILSLMLAVFPARGDIVTLDSGRKITCKVLREDEGHLWVRSGSIVLILDRETVASTEPGLSLYAIAQRLNESFEQSTQLIESEKRAKARTLLERELWMLELEIGTYDRPPEELIEWRRRIQKLHRETIPLDGASLEAQQMFEEAQALVDRVDYAAALPLLQRCVELSPDRSDIQVKLALVAEGVNEQEIALGAYRAILRSDAELYYNEVSRYCLRLLIRFGRQALGHGEPRRALPYYEVITLLDAGGDAEPVSYEEYVTRQKTREDGSRVDAMMTVFNYAQRRELIGLAFAAIEAAVASEPRNEKLVEMAEAWRFLNELRHLLSQGRKEEAVQLKAQTPDDILNSEYVRHLIPDIEGANAEELARGMMILQLKRAFDGQNFEAVLNLSERLTNDHPGSAEAREGKELAARARLELQVIQAVTLAREHLALLEIEQASSLVEQALIISGASATLNYSDLLALSTQLGREREALPYWTDAVDAFEREDFRAGYELLLLLAQDFQDTEIGKRAKAWLKENEERLLAREMIRKREKESLLSLIESARDRRTGQQLNASNLSDEAWQRFQAQLEADRRIDLNLGLRVLQVAVPSALALFLVLTLIPYFAWPGSGIFPLRTEEYMAGLRRIIRKRSDEAGKEDPGPDRSVDPGSSPEDAQIDASEAVTVPPKGAAVSSRADPVGTAEPSNAEVHASGHVGNTVGQGNLSPKPQGIVAGEESEKASTPLPSARSKRTESPRHAPSRSKSRGGKSDHLDDLPALGKGRRDEGRDSGGILSDHRRDSENPDTSRVAERDSDRRAPRQPTGSQDEQLPSLRDSKPAIKGSEPPTEERRADSEPVRSLGGDDEDSFAIPFLGHVGETLALPEDSEPDNLKPRASSSEDREPTVEPSKARKSARKTVAADPEDGRRTGEEQTRKAGANKSSGEDAVFAHPDESLTVFENEPPPTKVNADQTLVAKGSGDSLSTPSDQDKPTEREAEPDSGGFVIFHDDDSVRIKIDPKFEASLKQSERSRDSVPGEKKRKS